AQSGLRGLYRNRNDDLGARIGSLLGSNSNGRVQILQDPKGLDTKISEKRVRLYGELEGLPEELREAIAHYAINDPSQLEKLAK
ncbi:hypothetical protein K8R33_00710, partial [archaeon]|nr:hypothetical protein [archaeon]